MQMPSMLKQNADNVDNCAKLLRYPISALCAPASRSPAGWGAAARFHHNTNAEHIDQGEHRI